MLDHIASLILLLMAAAGLFLQSGIPSGRRRKHLFAYYTNLSNLAVLIYELVFYFTGLYGYSRLYELVRNPTARYIMMLTILITNLIYHFVLGAYFAKAGMKADREAGVSEEEIKRTRLRRFLLDPMNAGGRGRYEDGRSFWGNLLVHYFVPLLYLARWIAFAPKNIPFFATFIWLTVPAAYFIFCFIRAALGGPITRAGDRYPYDFISPDKLGTGRFIRNCVIVTLAYYILGLIPYLIF